MIFTGWTLPSGKFYPDVMALLMDGQVMAVEYKGAFLEDAARDERSIGEIRADASEGKCVFAMPVERDFAEIDRVMGWRPPKLERQLRV